MIDKVTRQQDTQHVSRSMALFCTDIFHAIANAADAKTCANLLCVDTCVSSLRPCFTSLHVKRAKEVLKGFMRMMQEDYDRLCNKDEQFACSIDMLKKMFSCAYSAELQYILHKHIQYVMQQEYVYSNVQDTFQKIVSDANNYTEDNMRICDIVNSYVFGIGFKHCVNITTFNNKYEICLVYEHKDDNVNICIIDTDNNETLYEEDHALHDVDKVLQAITDVCGEYAISKKPHDVSIDIETIKDYEYNTPSIYTMHLGPNQACNMLEVMAMMYEQVYTFINKSTNGMEALFD